MIKNAGDKTIDTGILVDILEMKKEKEEKKLEEMLKDAEKLIADQKALADMGNPTVTPEPEKEDAPSGTEEAGAGNVENGETILPTGNKEEENANVDSPAIKEEDNNNSTDLNNEQQN
jgi:hypothetical protein